MQWFAKFLVKQGIQRFQDVSKREIDLFLSGYKNNNTKNLYLQVLKSFYKDLKPSVVAHLRVYDVELEQITPSELLTLDDRSIHKNGDIDRSWFYKISPQLLLLNNMYRGALRQMIC